MPSRHDLLPKAQAIHDFPTPVGLLISTGWPSRIHRQVVSDWNRPRSRPRGVRRSTSSTAAACRYFAMRSRREARALSRAVTSRSIIRPSQSSRARSSAADWFCISVKASAVASSLAQFSCCRDKLLANHGRAKIKIGSVHVDQMPRDNPRSLPAGQKMARWLGRRCPSLLLETRDSESGLVRISAAISRTVRIAS